jgi:multidrug efflux pump subunit AcrA (membrane-fusion protein)
MQSVWVLNADNKPEQVRVKTGETDGTFTEIAGGDLKQGDKVIVAAVTKDGAAAAGRAFNAPQGGGGGRRGPGF